MTYEIVWEESALNTAARFLKTDPDGLRHVLASVDILAKNPKPVGTIPYGSPDLRRMHTGRYRVVYEVSESTITIVVLHLGRVA